MIKVSAKIASALAAVNPTLDPPNLRQKLDATGAISSADADVGITLECIPGQFTSAQDYIEVYIRDTSQPGAGWSVLIAAFPIGVDGDAVFPVFIPAPVSTGGFGHGHYELQFGILLDLGGVPGDLDEISFPIPFVVDRLAPYQAAGAGNSASPTVPAFSVTLPTPISQTFINSNPTLPIVAPPNTFTIPSGQFQPGDMIQFYVGPIPVPQIQFAAGAPFPMTATGGTFNLPSAAFINSGNGTVNVFYTITDQAGNVSRPSTPVPVQVSLIPAPQQNAIFIPLAPAPRGGSTDDLLNVVDYVTGIDAWVETYLNKQPNDRIEIQVGSQPWSLLSNTFTTFPLVFFTGLPALFRAEYGTQDGPQPVTVLYRIVRGPETFDSLPVTINVDFSVPGALNPNEPGTDNLNLIPAQFFGQVSNLLNELHDVDEGLPVTVVIEIWTMSKPPQAGDTIFVTTPDGSIIMPGFDISTAGSTITFTIPWSAFIAGGNTVQNFRYIVGNAAANNANKSPPTQVNVVGAVTQAMTPPAIRGLLNNAFDCNAITSKTAPGTYYLDIFLDPDPKMQVGQQLDLTLVVSRPRVGPPVESQTAPFTVTITPAIQLTGHTFRIAYGPLLKVARLGLMQATVSTTFAGGVIGRGSITVNARTVLSKSYCDFSAVPPGP